MSCFKSRCMFKYSAYYYYKFFLLFNFFLRRGAGKSFASSPFRSFAFVGGGRRRSRAPAAFVRMTRALWSHVHKRFLQSFGGGDGECRNGAMFTDSAAASLRFGGRGGGGGGGVGGDGTGSQQVHFLWISFRHAQRLLLQQFAQIQPHFFAWGGDAHFSSRGDSSREFANGFGVLHPLRSHD